MATNQDELLSTIRELVRRGSNSPSDADLAAFVELVRTEKHGEALLSTLVEAKEVSTSDSFKDDDDSWKLKLKSQTPASARFFATVAVALLEVTASEIAKKAEGKVTVGSVCAIPLVTASGTLYYYTVQQLNGTCGVTVNCSGAEFTARFWHLERRLGKREIGDLTAVFIGKVDATASDVKAFRGIGDATWENLRQDHHHAS